MSANSTVYVLVGSCVVVVSSLGVTGMRSGSFECARSWIQRISQPENGREDYRMRGTGPWRRIRRGGDHGYPDEKNPALGPQAKDPALGTRAQPAPGPHARPA
jgi:hypothetical protein